MYQPHQNSNAFEGLCEVSSDLGYILTAEYCMDPEIEADELRHSLVTLNADLKRIDREFDYLHIIRPLLVVLHVPSSPALLDRMRRRKQCEFDQLQAQHHALDRLQAPATFKAAATLH